MVAVSSNHKSWQIASVTLIPPCSRKKVLTALFMVFCHVSAHVSQTSYCRNCVTGLFPPSSCGTCEIHVLLSCTPACVRPPPPPPHHPRLFHMQLCHKQLCQTQLFHTQLFRKQLFHTPTLSYNFVAHNFGALNSFAHTSVTRNLVTHTHSFVTHTHARNFCHTHTHMHTHTYTCTHTHAQTHMHNVATDDSFTRPHYFSMAGAALAALGWLWWHPLAVQAWHLLASDGLLGRQWRRGTLRGKRGSSWH